MRILALEPYHGGSHKAFLDHWIERSRHDWTVLGLPPFKWKWRMRHAAVTFAQDVAARVEAGEAWNVIFCSDMLNLAEFYGLAPASLRGAPSVAYFHENQLTYPVREESERDYHFVCSNLITALAASRVWWNSQFNRDSFLGALPDFLALMPDHQPVEAIDAIRAKSEIHPQGVGTFPLRGPRKPGPMRLLWAARWEHDKEPKKFFDALDRLKSQGIPFRLSVIGEQFREAPEVFDWARERFAGQIDRWGYQPSRTEYEASLLEADVIVSTAAHEFFGISVVEAVAAGAWPVVPRSLAYPEVLGSSEEGGNDDFFYSGGARKLSEKLADLAARIANDDLWLDDPLRGVRTVARFAWERLAPAMDEAMERVCEKA